MSSPEKSKKYGDLICTAGINLETMEWRRLWGISTRIRQSHQQLQPINRWNILNLNDYPTEDKRFETRKLVEDSIEFVGQYPKKKRYQLISRLCDNSLQSIIDENRSLGIIKPDFSDIKKKFGFFPSKEGVSARYSFFCENRCKVCENHPHKMENRDWGCQILIDKLVNDENRDQKIQNVLLDERIQKNDLFFGVGTHARWHKTWMVIGFLWGNKPRIPIGQQTLDIFQ
jgi:hypothetical protein